MPQALNAMENAYNHVENALDAARRELITALAKLTEVEQQRDMWKEKLQSQAYALDTIAQLSTKLAEVESHTGDVENEKAKLSERLAECEKERDETEHERKNAELRAHNNIYYCHGLWMKWLEKTGFVEHATFEGYIEDAECAEDAIRSILGKIAHERDQLRADIARKDAALRLLLDKFRMSSDSAELEQTAFLTQEEYDQIESARSPAPDQASTVAQSNEAADSVRIETAIAQTSNPDAAAILDPATEHALCRECHTPDGCHTPGCSQPWREVVEALVVAAREASETFRNYAALHWAKHTAEADKKAAANTISASKLDTQISRAEDLLRKGEVRE